MSMILPFLLGLAACYCAAAALFAWAMLTDGAPATRSDRAATLLVALCWPLLFKGAL